MVKGLQFDSLIISLADSYDIIFAFDRYCNLGTIVNDIMLEIYDYGFDYEEIKKNITTQIMLILSVITEANELIFNRIAGEDIDIEDTVREMKSLGIKVGRSIRAFFNFK